MPSSEHSSHPALRCSVVIPTWQRSSILRETLPSVLSQSYPEFDIHVVSDGEDLQLRTLAMDFADQENLHWHFNPQNRGQAAARNTGAQEADGDILLFLDDDTPPLSDWIMLHMRRHLASRAQAPLIVAGRIVERANQALMRVTDLKLQSGWEQTLENYAHLFRQTGPDSIGDTMETAISFGLNCSIRRDLFLQHGGFLEQLRVTDEDMELGLRLYLAGVETVFEPHAVVTHSSSKDLTAYFRRCWQASGTTDVQRVFQLKQHNAQTRRLISICHGTLPGQLHRRVYWHGAEVLRRLADLLEATANRTGSQLLASAWGRLCPQVLYWNAVRATGCTLRQIDGVAAPAKCALMLHSLCKPKSPRESTYYLSPQRFRLLMRHFNKAGYRTVTTAEWMRDDLPPKRALLTFDDGYDDLYTELLPWLQQHNFTALVFLVTENIGGTNLWDQQSGLRERHLLTLEQIREMQRHGVEFGSHSLTHPWLPGLSQNDLEREVRDSKRKLEDLLGVEVNSFAYPFGGVDRRVRAAVAQAGYKLAFTTLPGINRWNDPLSQRRADIHNQTTPFELRLHLRYGRGFRECGAALLHHLEDRAPTKALRDVVRGFREWGSRAIEKRNGRKRDRDWPTAVPESSINVDNQHIDKTE